MSVRIWLQKDGEVEVARLLKTGALANLNIHEHHTTGKKYIKLGVGLTDPTEEIPQIPQEIVERVTFKGKVYLFGDYSGNFLPPSGSFHSADMLTHMVVETYGKQEGQTHGRTWWCEVSVTSPSVVALQEMMERLIFGGPRSFWADSGSFPLLSSDSSRDLDRELNSGCFTPLPCF